MEKEGTNGEETEKMTDGLSWAIRGLETFIVLFIIAINIGIFGFLYPSINEMDCEACTYEKDLALAMIFLVPIPSAFLIWAIINSNLDSHVEDLKEK
jgi:hypothetical protein